MRQHAISFGPSTLPGTWNFLTYFLRSITVEPLMFFHSFGHVLGGTLYSTYAMNKICLQGSHWFGNGIQSQKGFNTSSNIYFQEPRIQMRCAIIQTMAIIVIFKHLSKELLTNWTCMKHGLVIYRTLSLSSLLVLIQTDMVIYEALCFSEL